MLSSQNKEAVMDDFGNNRGFTISGAIEFWKTKKWCSRIVTAQKSTDLEEPIITIFKNAKDKKNGKNGKTCTLTDFVALKKDFPLSGNNMTIAIVTLNFDLYLSFKNPLSQLLWYTWLKQNCPSFRTFDVQYLKGPNKLYQFEGRACNVYVTKLSFVVRCILSKGTQETLLQYYHQDLRLRRREDHVMEITVEATKQVYKLCGASVPMILKVCRNIVNCATDDRSDIDKYSEGYWLSSMPVLAVKDPEFYGGTLPRYTAYNPVQVVDGRRRSESAMHASLSQPGHTNVFEPSHNRLDRLSSTPQINTTTSLYKQNSKFSNSHIYPFYGKLRKFVVKSATSIAASDIQEERDYENVLPQKTNNYQVNDNQTQKLSLSQRLVC
uniref:SOCS box domain-containing protein n=1 Tax=Rhabditophanes sp. KR3021 TaxID=114890 RepID=A0AC35TI28_9BILA